MRSMFLQKILEKSNSINKSGGVTINPPPPIVEGPDECTKLSDSRSYLYLSNYSPLVEHKHQVNQVPLPDKSRSTQSEEHNEEININSNSSNNNNSPASNHHNNNNHRNIAEKEKKGQITWFPRFYWPRGDRPPTPQNTHDRGVQEINSKVRIMIIALDNTRTTPTVRNSQHNTKDDSKQTRRRRDVKNCPTRNSNTSRTWNNQENNI